MLGEREAWAKNQATYYDYYTTMPATTATTTTAAATSTIIYNSMPFFQSVNTDRLLKRQRQKLLLQLRTGLDHPEGGHRVGKEISLFRVSFPQFPLLQQALKTLA